LVTGIRKSTGDTVSSEVPVMPGYCFVDRHLMCYPCELGLHIIGDPVDIEDILRMDEREDCPTSRRIKKGSRVAIIDGIWSGFVGRILYITKTQNAPICSILIDTPIGKETIYLPVDCVRTI